MDDLVRKAKTFATGAHRRINQLRKYTGNPYEVHLKGVAVLVESVATDPEMIAAAWLHDTVEDTPATVDDIEREFGAGVAVLVAELTDVSRPSDGNRDARARINRDHLASASARAKTVKLADLIDNCRDIVRHDPRFAPTYLAEMAALLDVLGDGDPRLYARAHSLLSDSSERLGLGRTDDPAEIHERDVPPFERDLLATHRKTLRLFARTFLAADIAEPLALVEQPGSAGGPTSHREGGSTGIRFVREGGIVAGYLRHRNGSRTTEPEPSRPIRSDQVVEADASLADVIEVLTRHDHCLVQTGGRITGVIERADIQKPLVRMWLFGIITLVEMYFTRRIRDLWPDGSWANLLTPQRRRVAEQLRDERIRLDRHCELIDCLQFADKSEILLQNPAQPALFGFDSRGSARRVAKEMQSLRNNLAHAQDITLHDWPQIVRLARRVETLYENAQG